VGCIGVLVPGVLGTGYGWVQAGLDRQSLMALPLWIVIVLPFAKIVATSLSIGSGGSGGIFGPGMVIGGLLGATIWRLLVDVAPAVPLDPAPFVIVAMMALFGSIAHAPLAVMLMVAEMTGNLSMLAPAMIAIGIATVVVGDRSIYSSQLKSRVESPAHQFRFALPLMASIPAGDAARVARLVLRSGQRVEAAGRQLRLAHVPGAPVIDPDGKLRGVITLAALAKADPGARVGDLASDLATTVSADDGLDEALGALANHHLDWIPVTSDGRLVGILSTRDAMTAYRRALAGNIRRIRGLEGEGVLLEGELPAGSPLIGAAIANAGLPPDVVVVGIQRAGTLIIPNGATTLQATDRLTLFVTPQSEHAARALMKSPAAPVRARAVSTEPE
jgi:hypothetical protein